ncbi:SPOR domain-containing protein [Vibrio neptunius]|uniref:AAA family ATPase n=1 Tax=Vibrio neptunius TaxID=170651 RepID=A0ABS3A9V0_9VIBR|nr:AAA family ATPase [Vibrio neptunius]MBN3495143.1 AAA family ATPase [Vibrio neptunius]MBN3517599.1 AAA family ATPase [Vibrio neptunius]MBN3551950.1 AAA family ATPase [Vibrio neptunius]MBN3579944.1 AAA family ATPase [Vibrio neptunius]MCH9873610.1 AAA family ATPase [Vibrio neptunius]
MSLTHESRVLELDSQVELLERMQLLTNFGSNLVTVGGALGAGKSWLAQRYLEAWAPDKNQSLLMCHPNQDAQQRRTMILTQLFSEPMYNPSDPLTESFARQMQGEGCDVVIVIDDAHLLQESFVSELWMLVLEAQENPAWTINVVLFAQSNSLDVLLTRLSYGQDHKPIDLEIDTLSQDEADRFFEHLVIRFVEDEKEKRVRNAYRTVARRPGEIMALGDHKVEKRIIIRSIIGSPINVALLVVTLLVFIGGGYWWMMSQPSPDEQAQKMVDAIEQTVIPTLPEDSTAESTLADVQAEGDVVLSPAEDDSESLPPAVTEQTSSVGNSESDHQRVVITSEVVDALLDGKPEKADTTAIKQVVESPSAEREKTATQSLVSIDSVDQTESPAQPEKTIVQFSFTRDELKRFSPRSYTLQLAAVRSLEDVQVFLDKHRLADNVYIYPTVRNDVEWFIITYQNYPTIQVARDAVEALPDELQQLDPWAKSLSQVHREIDRVK